MRGFRGFRRHLSFLAFLAAAAASLVAAPARAQDLGSATFAYAFDVDSATRTYCIITGQNGDPYGGPIAGSAPIETSGSSTTVTAVTAGTLPFASLAVGDSLLVTRGTSVTDVRILVAKASGDSVTVDAAINLDVDGGFQFRWLDQTCGTAVTNGWLDVSRFRDKTFFIQFEQGDLATSLNFAIECLSDSIGQAPVQISPADPTTTTAIVVAGVGTIAGRAVVSTSAALSSCRVALVATGADTSDAGANIERVMVSFLGKK